MKSKSKVLLFLSLFGLIMPASAVAQSVSVKTEASLLNSVIVDIESGIDIFFTKGMSDYVVSSFETETGNPAVIKVSGALVEMMIDLEFQQANGTGADSNQPIVISEFNILDKKSGSSVNVMPAEDEEFFLLTIGGTVKNVEEADAFYTGVNVLNINYL